MSRTYIPENLRVSWPLRVSGIVSLVGSFVLCCSAAVTLIYGPEKLPSSRLGAPAGISLGAASIALLTWIRPVLFPERRRWLFTAISVAAKTFALLEIYAGLVGWAGPDSLFVTIFGFSATHIFREDAWIVFPMICAPILAFISGTLCATTCWIMARLMTSAQSIRLK
jgi:hypothetical protein